MVVNSAVDTVSERIRIERAARHRGIDTHTLWAAAEDSAANAPDRRSREEVEVRFAWFLLAQDWRPRGSE